MWTAFQAWWRRNVVAPDPDPRYSYLDRLDGLNDLKERPQTILKEI